VPHRVGKQYLSMKSLTDLLLRLEQTS